MVRSLSAILDDFCCYGFLKKVREIYRPGRFAGSSSMVCRDEEKIDRSKSPEIPRDLEDVNIELRWIQLRFRGSMDAFNATLPSRIASLVHGHFDTLPKRSKPTIHPDGSREWIPMSGMVVVKGTDSKLQMMLREA